jgi:hypothetical protein
LVAPYCVNELLFYDAFNAAKNYSRSAICSSSHSAAMPWCSKRVILIPAFAVGRAQQILYYLWELRLRFIDHFGWHAMVPDDRQTIDLA